MGWLTPASAAINAVETATTSPVTAVTATVVAVTVTSINTAGGVIEEDTIVPLIRGVVIDLVRRRIKIPVFRYVEAIDTISNLTTAAVPASVPTARGMVVAEENTFVPVVRICRCNVTVAVLIAVITAVTAATSAVVLVATTAAITPPITAARGMVIEENTYVPLIRGMVSQGGWRGALDLIRDMVKQGVQPRLRYGQHCSTTFFIPVAVEVRPQFWGTGAWD